MNALSLFNNFEREFGRPFFRTPAVGNWLETTESNNAERVLPSTMKYDEKKAAWSLMVELAGVTKDNIKIDTTDGYLQLTGEKTKGLSTGNFEGLYRLPDGIDTEKIVATFEDGILNVDMPMTEKKLTKSIQIK